MGAFNSPRILEITSIGDADRLARLGVDNTNVGEKMQNHIMCRLSSEVGDEPDIETFEALVRREPAAVAAATEA